MDNYYDKNALKFFKNTVDVDMTPHYEKFLRRIPEGNILDAGCGSGRDSLFFKNKGYNVTAIDSSYEMSKLATQHSGINVINMKFQDIEFNNEFDGIWASSSLLHVPSDELPEVLLRFHKSLKDDGILYASFKYGDFEGIRNGRYFVDLNEDAAYDLFAKYDFHILDVWLSSDSRKGRHDEKWLNILVKKI